jgi:hypothetical protein
MRSTRTAPYLLNHILITNGWAEDVDYGDRTYDKELQTPRRSRSDTSWASTRSAARSSCHSGPRRQRHPKSR